MAIEVELIDDGVQLLNANFGGCHGLGGYLLRPRNDFIMVPMAQVRDSALALLKEAFGEAARFRDGQLDAIEVLLKPGARLLLVQSTGWGKSVVYFLAARLLGLERRGKTLIVSPLISLMRNQVEFARRLNLNAAALHSENRDEWPTIEKGLTDGSIDVLLISPERLHQAEFRREILPRLVKELALAVIDEAHCISEWGHDFRPEYRTILRELKDLPKEAAVLGTTATATERVVEDLRILFGPFLDVHRGPLARATLSLIAIEMADKSERLAWLAKYLPRFQGSGIVYTLTVFDAMEVARWLQKQGIDAEAYHADLDGSRRVELETAFKENRLKALVATTALGMGYDKSDVGFVVHYQLPSSLISYYQQIGRAGRALERAFCVVLASETDEEVVQALAETSRPPKWVFEQVVRALEDGPKTFSELCHKLKAAGSAVKQVLEIFDAVDAVTELGGKHTVRTYLAEPEIARGEEIRNLRIAEFREMIAYVRSDRCRMQIVAAALGDAVEEKCGHCDRCKPIPEAKLDPSLMVEARAFLEGEPKALIPRTQLPASEAGPSRRLTADEKLEQGIVLGSYGDQGWGKLVREGKYGEGRFAETLLEAAARAVASSTFKPEWITWVPSSRPEAPVADFAKRLGKKLDLLAVESVRRVKPRPPQKVMEGSAEQIANVWDSFDVHSVLQGPCLLVDDIVDSGWTLTIVGMRLREAGCPAVMPLALAAASTARIKFRDEVSS